MKLFVLLTTLLISFSVSAEQNAFDFLLQAIQENEAPIVDLERAGCANSTADIANIAGLLKKVSPWGAWHGTYNGKPGTVNLSKGGANFTGKANYDGKNYGPAVVTICDHGSSYTIGAQGYEVSLQVLSSTKIQVNTPFGAIVLTK